MKHMTNKYLWGGIVAVVVLIGAVAWWQSPATPALEEQLVNVSPSETKVTMIEEQGQGVKESAPDTADKKGETMMAEGLQGALEIKSVSPGVYAPYSPGLMASVSQTGKAVLFFRASWCPTCKALDSDIRAHLAGIPEGLTILDVDYDRETELKQRYGITYQHTFVQIDAQGNAVHTWSGSPTLTAFLAHIR
jgi:thiol-disulfide isomerase/thioredoxin